MVSSVIDTARNDVAVITDASTYHCLFVVPVGISAYIMDPQTKLFYFSEAKDVIIYKNRNK
jgi:hypothetical protein